MSKLGLILSLCIHFSDWGNIGMAVGETKLPKHIAFIMDGNGRWAEHHGVPRVEGHRSGSKAMEEIVKYSMKLGIPCVTFFAFSTENWKRPKEEVDALMMLLRQYLSDLERQVGNDARIIILGDITGLGADLEKRILAIQKKTAKNSKITVNIAFNYGARDELVRAAKELAQQVAFGTLLPSSIDEEVFAGALYTAGQLDPDLIIRPSGEKRLSNFLLWQAAYAELIFMDVLWPDFDSAVLDEALAEYAHRNRRFGGRNLAEMEHDR